MTACVKNHSKRVALAISASLVGALTLGAAAPAAFAANGIDAQFAEDTELTNGTVQNLAFETFNGTTWVDVAGQYVGEDADGNVTVNANQLPVRTDITGIQLAGGGKTETVTSATVSNYKTRLYRADEDGEPTGTPLSGNKAVDAGEYVVTITALNGSAFEGQTFKTSFIIVGEKLPRVTAYEGDDKSDHTFIYTGSPLDVNFSFTGGRELVEGRDYTVSYKVGSQDVDSVEDVATYTAVITGKGIYAGSTAQTSVPVKPFLVSQSAVTVEIDPFTMGSIPTTPSRVYYTDGDGNRTYLDPSLVNVAPADGVTINDEKTTPYNFKVSVSESVLSQGNVTWTDGATKSAQGYMVDKIVDFTYGGAALQDSYELDSSAKEKFNTSAITASWGRGSLTVPDGEVIVEKTAGDFTADAKKDLNDGVFGEYTVTVNVPVATDFGGAGYADNVIYAGTKTFTVKIWKGVVDVDEDLYVYTTERADAITSYAKAYDGETMTEGYFYVYGTTTTGINLTTADIQKKLVDADGNTVQSATAAGEYKLVVESEWYKLQDGTTELPVSIAKVDLTTLQIGRLVKWNDVAGMEYLPFDSDANTPDIWVQYFCNDVTTAINHLLLSFDTGNGSEDSFVADNFKGMDLIPESVDVEVEVNDNGTWKPVGIINAAGQYRVIVSVADDVASNFVLPEGKNSVTIEFTAGAKGTFSDVQLSDWCYEAVEKAVNNGYMYGYAGTTSFGPWDKLTRGQVAIVLFNMSGQKSGFNETSSGHYNELRGWETGFGDVDGHQYYAQAIAWAKSTGVVEGYKDGSGNFGPDDPVTREQFAQMMANYAKVVNRDVTVDQADPASLDEMSDGGQVSGWAQKAVAWAVENDVMGSQGSVMPQDTMDRAMCAQMTVNYQPNNK